MARAARPCTGRRPEPPAHSTSLEAWLLGALLLVALVARLVGLGSIEPNVLPDEADHLSLLYHVLAAHGPGPFDLSWDGNPAASLYPALLFLKLLGPSFVSLRLSTSLGSLLALIAFYLLARGRLSRFASFGTTVLLAFSGWYLFFSRNGEVNIWALVYLLGAAVCVQRALDHRVQWDWLLGGVFCGLGWYSYLGGVFILPTILLYLLVLALLEPARRGECLRGGIVLCALTLGLLLPRLPILIEKREAVELYVGMRSILRQVPPDRAPGVLMQQLAISLRTFVLLDGSQRGNPRYLQPGAPPIDPLSGGLYLVGLGLSLRRLRQTALWWCILGPVILVLQPLTIEIPDGARALPALPAMLLFAGLAIDWLTARPHLAGFVRLALTIAIPLTALASWTHYVDWQRQPLNALARQPAVELDEFDAWRALQQDRARADQPGFTVDQWKAAHGRDRLAPKPPP